MSRSYRKHTYFNEEPKHRNKKYANRKVRRNKELLQNNDYKRYYDSWNIHSPWKIKFFGEQHYVNFERGYLEEKEARKSFRKNFRSK